MGATRSISVNHLMEFCVTAMTIEGMTKKDAEVTAEVLVTTDTWGTFTHGTKQLHGLLKNFRDNRMRRTSVPECVSGGTSWTLYDGHQCMPMVSSTMAMSAAIRKAKATGIAVSIVKNSGHFGAAGYYANMAAEENLIGISLTNVDPCMAVPGSRGPVLGTNPISYAVPAGEEHPVMLDIATSVVAGSKIFAARDSEQSIPLGWLIDKEGMPTTDPKGFPETGTLMPMAGHKGYGIALLIEILTGVLSGGAFAKDVKSWVLPLQEPVNQSHCFVAIDVGFFMPVDEFTKRMDALIREIRNAPRAKGAGRIYLPGEMEWEKREKALQEGIAMPEHVMVRLRDLAEELGLDIEDLYM